MGPSVVRLPVEPRHNMHHNMQHVQQGMQQGMRQGMELAVRRNSPQPHAHEFLGVVKVNDPNLKKGACIVEDIRTGEQSFVHSKDIRTPIDLKKRFDSVVEAGVTTLRGQCEWNAEHERWRATPGTVEIVPSLAKRFTARMFRHHEVEGKAFLKATLLSREGAEAPPHSVVVYCPMITWSECTQLGQRGRLEAFMRACGDPNPPLITGYALDQGRRGIAATRWAWAEAPAEAEAGGEQLEQQTGASRARRRWARTTRSRRWGAAWLARR